MPRYNKQQLDAQYQKLPDVLKTVMFSDETASQLWELGRKYGLNIEKNGFLADEVGYLILGLTKPNDLPAFIKESTGLLDEEIPELMKDLNNMIFSPLREALKKAHNIEIEASIQKQESGKTTSVPPAAATQRPTAEIKPKAIDIPSAAPGVFPQPRRVAVPVMSQSETTSPAKKLEELMTKTVPPPIPEASTKKQEPREETKAEKIPFSSLSDKKPVPPEQTTPAVPKPLQPPAPKIPPIDLRQIKPAAETKPVGTTPEAAPTVYPTKSALPKPSEKKTPYTGADPYKEPVD